MIQLRQAESFNALFDTSRLDACIEVLHYSLRPRFHALNIGTRSSLGLDTSFKNN